MFEVHPDCSFPAHERTENNYLSFINPLRRRRLRTKFSHIEKQEYGVNKWPPAGKPTLK